LKDKTPAYLSRLQLPQRCPKELSTLHVDAIESIAKKNIASALRTGESAPKSVFASIVTISLQLPGSKLT